MKKFLPVLFVCFSLFLFSCAIDNTENPDALSYEHKADSGTLGLWHFNETSGQTMADSSSNGRDLSLGATTAVSADDPVITDSGRTEFGNCLLFDKSNLQLVYGSYTVPLVSNSFTVELWMKSTDTGVTSYLLWSDSIAFYLSKDVDDHFSAGVGNSSDWINHQAGSVDLADGNWHYLALTYDYATTTMIMYDNGSPVMTDTTASATVPDPTTIYIGGHAALTLSGYIDEVRLTDHARSASEISAYWTAATQ